MPQEKSKKKVQFFNVSHQTISQAKTANFGEEKKPVHFSHSERFRSIPDLPSLESTPPGGEYVQDLRVVLRGRGRGRARLVGTGVPN